MLDWVRIVWWSVVSALKGQRDLTLENVALRHQLMVLQRQSGRPRLRDRDRLFWICLRRRWPGWHRALVLVQPATVVNWHRNGFRAYWRWKSRSNGGRPRIDREVRELIRDMWRSNPTWGKPRIQAELNKIGIEVSDSTISKYRPSQDRPPSQSWRAFLDNHLRDVVAIDVFVVPTLTFRVLSFSSSCPTTGVASCTSTSRPRLRLGGPPSRCVTPFPTIPHLAICFVTVTVSSVLSSSGVSSRWASRKSSRPPPRRGRILFMNV